LKIYRLKRTAIPKIAVLATGLIAAVLVATINPTPAQAYPRAASCTGCHAGTTASTVTAIPSTATPASGASYTVAITLSANPTGGFTGYGIVPIAPAVEKTFGGNTGSELSFTATMVAPTAAGTYSYTVWTNQGPTSAGQVGSKVYSITVAPVVTIPPTTVPPTTVPPTTVPPTIVPPTTVPPTTVPPTTVPPTTVPPTTVPPTTVPPTTVPAKIYMTSPRHGRVGDRVTIYGQRFGGSSGVVKFGAINATVSYWSSSVVSVTVPSGVLIGDTAVTVTPTGGAVSNAVNFVIDPSWTHTGDGDDESGNLSPSGTLGVQHLTMYTTYRATCAACHDGVGQPAAPAISVEGANMKPGIACASCHAAGKSESETPLFISLMNDPTRTVYSRCNDCHVVTGSSDD